MECNATGTNSNTSQSSTVIESTEHRVANMTNDAIRRAFQNDVAIESNTKNGMSVPADGECNGCDDSEDADAVDHDWLMKLTNGKASPRVPPTDGTSDWGVIPLLCDDDLDFKEKTLKTLRVGLKKIWKRGSATITAEDPTYKVAYLGNVLTGWAKGEGCIDKPLNTLWKNYNGCSKPNVQMKITVTQSGLKAVTKDHGLIEYWSHRITYCTVPSELPRIFCWIYRHEGRKLKQELRCHAVLCSKESVAARMATTLKIRLTQALLEFKRDKLLRQNARLSLANSVYDNPSLPRRKILLSTGSHNYKPPLERSKSAPKLMSIEESLEEEESTPKVKRKANAGVDVDPDSTNTSKGFEEFRRNGSDDKCDFKLTNLNFVKKLCSSIENLVESTSNYSRKFLTECKANKESYLSMKSLEGGAHEKTAGAEKRPKPKKSVTFEVNRSSPVKCTEFKRLDEEQRSLVEITVDAPKEPESDEGSNSLQSISSCCSDVSSLVTSGSDKSLEGPPSKSSNPVTNVGSEYLTAVCDAPIDRLHTYLTNCNDAFLNQVVLRPAGDESDSDSDSGKFVNEADEAAFEGDTDCVHFTENLVQRLSLDVPYHKLIKSDAVAQRRIRSSCLQI